MKQETQKKLNRILELTAELEELLNQAGGGVISSDEKTEENPVERSIKPKRQKTVGKRSILTEEIKKEIRQMVDRDGLNSQTISEKLGLKYQTVWAFVNLYRKKKLSQKPISVAKAEMDAEPEEEDEEDDSPDFKDDEE